MENLLYINLQKFPSKSYQPINNNIFVINNLDVNYQIDIYYELYYIENINKIYINFILNYIIDIQDKLNNLINNNIINEKNLINTYISSFYILLLTKKIDTSLKILFLTNLSNLDVSNNILLLYNKNLQDKLIDNIYDIKGVSFTLYENSIININIDKIKIHLQFIHYFYFILSDKLSNISILPTLDTLKNSKTFYMSIYMINDYNYENKKIRIENKTIENYIEFYLFNFIINLRKNNNTNLPFKTINKINSYNITYLKQIYNIENLNNIELKYNETKFDIIDNTNYYNINLIDSEDIIENINDTNIIDDVPDNVQDNLHDNVHDTILINYIKNIEQKIYPPLTDKSIKDIILDLKSIKNNKNYKNLSFCIKVLEKIDNNNDVIISFGKKHQVKDAVLLIYERVELGVFICSILNCIDFIYISLDEDIEFELFNITLGHKLSNELENEVIDLLDKSNNFNINIKLCCLVGQFIKIISCLECCDVKCKDGTIVKIDPIIDNNLLSREIMFILSNMIHQYESIEELYEKSLDIICDKYKNIDKEKIKNIIDSFKNNL
jgi:hypothetical protein